MSNAQIIEIIGAATALVTAVTALIHSIRTRSTINSAKNQPVSLPHADTERAEGGRDVPMGFSPPESRA